MRGYERVHRDGARHGYVDTRAAERTYGIDGHALVRHLARLGWRPYLPGLWVPAGEPAFEERCALALAHVGGPALLTGATALHALGILRAAPARVEVLIPADRRLRRRDGLCLHHATSFGAVSSMGWKGLKMVRAPRALADHSAHASVSALCRAVADATRLRHCTLAQVAAEVDRRARFPGRGRLRGALGELTGELNHSRYERLGRALLRQGGLVVPSRPGPVEHRGRTLAEVDVPFYDVCYGVEIDGPPHLLPEQAARDRARDRMLASTCGWRIDRFLWFELEEQPGRFIREIVARVTALRGG